MAQKHIVVVGAGVTGISAALLLRRAGHAVTIIARDFPAPFETIDPVTQINYTSPWGGAHNRWVPPTPTNAHTFLEHSLSLTTYAHMKSLHASNPQTSGITFLPGIEYLESPPPEYLALSAAAAGQASATLKTLQSVSDFRILPPSAFPDAKVTWACAYTTYCVNPMVYLSFLLRRFFHLGGKIVKRELRSAQEVFSLSPLSLFSPSAGTAGGGGIDAVVNASGTNFNQDPDVFVTRGQTVLVAEECDATVTRQNADGSWTFSVPRGFEGGTIIGGTKEVDNWDVAPDPQVRKELLRKFGETYPKIFGDDKRKELTVLKDIVGRRPTRKGGPRIEGEVLGGGFVMHAYGLGGRGYELSWGVAEKVVEGVEGYFRGEGVKEKL
ncbi:putative D-amino-acid oxidase [Cladorrhinum sp. PSN332]|nr:putative D-amino-acid oxidase [Cladorrhinum sp. PSN332]